MQGKHFVLFPVLVAAAFAAVAAFAGASAQPAAYMATPDELKWTDGPSYLPPGAKMAMIEGSLNGPGPFTYRLKLPANYQIQAHSHPNVEHVTVISGTYNMGVGEKLDKSKTKRLPAGSIAIFQPKTKHFAWTDEETVIQVYGMGPRTATYVNPADDPRKKKSP
jgi:quercetin dioxygenase-like cupin family protein